VQFTQQLFYRGLYLAILLVIDSDQEIPERERASLMGSKSL
jgi:hypothetical protein